MLVVGMLAVGMLVVGVLVVGVLVVGVLAVGVLAVGVLAVAVWVACLAVLMGLLVNQRNSGHNRSQGLHSRIQRCLFQSPLGSTRRPRRRNRDRDPPGYRSCSSSLVLHSTSKVLRVHFTLRLCNTEQFWLTARDLLPDVDGICGWNLRLQQRWSTRSNAQKAQGRCGLRNVFFSCCLPSLLASLLLGRALFLARPRRMLLVS